MLRTCLLLGLCLYAPLGSAADGADHYAYDLSYHAEFLPEAGYAAARIEVRQAAPNLRRVDLNAPAAAYSGFSGDGEVRRDGDRVLWEIPSEGGTLRYNAIVDHKRDGVYDARMTDAWALLRLDDLFPPMRSRSNKHAHGHARLAFAGPKGWSFETPYGPVEGSVPVQTPGRRLDRPLGWMVAGNLGIRRMKLGERRVAVAGPRGESFRSLDLLTFLHWTMPVLFRIAPQFPDRVLIVSGSHDMWRGGLSGPGSLYIHPDRPLVSGNSTSPVLHELMHVATAEPPVRGDDWIAEGLAEYYSLAILLRSGGISGARFERSLAWLADWARRDGGRLTDASTGANTARAALLFRDLTVELSADGKRLDAVVARLLDGPLSRRRLVDLVAAELGHPSVVLARALGDTE